MSENSQQNSQFTGLNEKPEFNLPELLFSYLRYWYWFILVIAASLFVAYLYLRYSTPVYVVRSEIIIKDDKGGLSQNNILSELDIFNTKNNAGDEIEILKTRYLMEKVVEELELNVSYYAPGKIKTSELYNTSPFYVTILSPKDSIVVQQFHLHIRDGAGFLLENDSIKINRHFEDTIIIPHLTMILHRKQGFNFNIEDYLFNISSPAAATNEYLNNFSADFVSKQTNAIKLTINTITPRKGEAILNKLYEVYTRIDREDKNKIADSTISFINDRLGKVADELSDVDKNVEQFKKNNNLSSDEKAQSNLLLNNISEFEKQIIQQEVQVSVVESIENHLKSNAYRIVPGALVIQDPTYLSMVEKYNNLVLERDDQLQTSKESNPLITGLNQQIENLKIDLLTSLRNIKQGMLIAKNELSQKNNQMLGLVNATPSKERAFQDISRQQAVKQQLYLYLLQKREETAISKSGTLANSRLIEPAKSDSLPFTPKPFFIYLVALCTGILLPILIIYAAKEFNNKITTRREILTATNIPVLGELGHNKSGETIVAKKDSRTAISEQFRNIRTNLDFIVKGKDHQVILVTSSMSGEGKSFFCLNLASSLSISGKKVVLLELDLRKPKISKELGLSQEDGFSNYMVAKLQKEQLPKKTVLHPNLFVISSGTLPPNPAELLLQDEVEELFVYLRKTFDYIIIDTPPVGLVSDAILIAKHADASIYIIRQNFTLKHQLPIINDLAVKEKMSNLCILFNDVKLNPRYGYGYRYGDSYYSDLKQSKWVFFKSKSKG